MPLVHPGGGGAHMHGRALLLPAKNVSGCLLGASAMCMRLRAWLVPTWQDHNGYCISRRCHTLCSYRSQPAQRVATLRSTEACLRVAHLHCLLSIDAYDRLLLVAHGCRALCIIACSTSARDEKSFGA